MATIAYKDLFLRQEPAKCLLCFDAPCSAACPKELAPDRAIRSLRFENPMGAAELINSTTCLDCPAPCEEACIHYDGAVRIKKLAESLEPADEKKVDLSIDFCGKRCENPFFLSSSIVAGNYEMCARALRAGWSGVVFKTIGFFVPQEVSPRFDATKKESTNFVGFRNLEQISDHPLDENLRDLKRLKQEFPDKVIVASIMGRNSDEWSALAELVTEAGVDMIECNFSCPQMTVKGTGADVGQSPVLVGQYTRAVRKSTHLPVLAKMTPNLADMTPPAIAAAEGGADGIAAINTIKSISGIELKEGASPPHIHGKSAVSGYSGKAVKPIALRFISDMAKDERLAGVPISGMGGIETWHDAAEFLALGCTNVQVTTAVMEYGYRIIDDLVSGLSEFLAESGYGSLREFCGSALKNIISAEELDRESVEYPILGGAGCTGCGRCYIACSDAGHQAIEFDVKARKPKLIGSKCVGCHLCRLVCPREAVGITKRVHKRHTERSEKRAV